MQLGLTGFAIGDYNQIKGFDFPVGSCVNRCVEFANICPKNGF